jgi:heme exporter protein B
MIFWRQARVLMRHELRLERRAGETWAIILPFSLGALVAVPLAIGTDLPLISRIGPAIFWVVALLFGMQIAFRYASPDRGPTRDLVVLLGVDPGARFTGRAIANGLLLIAFMTILGVGTLFLYTPEGFANWPWLIIVGLLFAVGLAQVSTLVGELTAGLGARPTLGPLLVTPLALPLVIAASQATNSLNRDGGILPWLLMLALADMVLAIVGVLTARPLEETAG